MSRTTKKTPVTLIKLGGSVVTDKAKLHSYRHKQVQSLAKELHTYFRNQNEACFIGHGQGSFGHPAVKQHQDHFRSRQAFKPQAMAEMLRVVSRLHEHILDDLVDVGLPAVSYRLSQNLILQPSTPPNISATLVQHLFDLGVIPVTTGDIVLDTATGNRVLSTETIFLSLIEQIQRSKNYFVQRVVYVTQVAGVLDKNQQVIPKIGANQAIDQSLFFSNQGEADVTGAMLHKVQAAQEVARMSIPVAILSPQSKQNLTHFLRNKKWIGTRIT